MAYFSHVSVDQTVTVESGNSSTTNLVARTSFTGTAASTLGVAAIQIMLKTDKNCTVQVQQSGSDPSSWDLTDTYSYNKITNNFGVTVQAVGAYFRVIVTNDDSADTTYFRLNTVICPIVEAIPRSLDSLGNLKTSVNGLADKFGTSGQFSPRHDMKVCQPYKLVGHIFGSANDPAFWTPTNSGANSGASVANGKATLTSGTANSGYGQITSVRSARYIFANPMVCRLNLRLTSVAVAGCTRRFGVFSLTATTTPNDGYYFSVDPNGLLSVNTSASGSVTNTVSSGAFNGQISFLSLDTNVHSYEILYSEAAVRFYVDDVLIHTITPTTATLVNNYTLPITATSINSAAGTTSGVIELWNAAILRWGRDIAQSISYFFPTGQTAGVQLKIGAGNAKELVICNHSNGSVITLSDSTTTSTPVIMSITTSNSNNIGTAQPSVIPLESLAFSSGLRLTVASNNASVLVVYE